MENISRKKFIRTTVAGAAGLSVIPWFTGCRTSVNDTIRIGVIGLGRQSVFLTHGFQQISGIKIVAGSDVYDVKRQRFENNVKKMQEENQQSIEVRTYENYQDLLSRDDIDAVVIATPDHWHALITLDACKAGKDIYLEKPLTFTIKEGMKLCDAVRTNKLILGVGSQQRSDLNFQHAVNMVREGKLGNLRKINAYVGATPSPYLLPEEEIPAGLNWDKWLGPNPYIHYNSKLNPPISLDPVQNETFWAEWRYYAGIGGGFICDWGAHMFDIAQWALNKDNGGPVKVIPAGFEGQDYISFVYENGIVVANEPYNDSKGFGVKFQSDDAWIEVSRGSYSASDESLMPAAEGGAAAGVAYETGTPHLENFIASVRSRKDTIAPVEAGHRSGSLGILGNIATTLNRPLDWDPVNQQFVADTEADTHLHRQYREGYQI
jgi:predicted dehydrogenase